METFNGLYISGYVKRESDIPSDDERDDSPGHRQPKAKQKRKPSTISLRDTGKVKNRSSKGRQSLAQTNEEIADALRLVKTCDLKSNNDDQHTASDELQAEQDDNSDEAASRLMKQLTIDEDVMTERLQRNETTNTRKNEYTANGLNLPYKDGFSWSRGTEQKNTLLEDKLANDNEFDVTGIMNLSSLNVTDNDLPAIIQRAFCGGRKKCAGLILRDNSLTSDGVRMIVDTLLAARISLKYLSFSNNTDIGDAGVEHIVRLLQKNRSIIFLALPCVGMTDRGVRLLADTLCGIDAADLSSPPSPSPPLEKLYISFNKLVTDESLEAILQILENNQTLKVLSVEHCSLSDKARKQLRQVGSKMKKKKFSLSQ